MSARFRATAILVALAAIAFLTYRHYQVKPVCPRACSQGSARVLVAKTAISKGTSARVITAKPLYTVETLRENQVQKDAFDDPSSFKGEVAVKRIDRGQQLTAADFGPKTR